MTVPKEKQPFKFETYYIAFCPAFGVCSKCNALVPASPAYLQHHMEHHWLTARMVIDGGSTNLLPEECPWVVVLTDEELHPSNTESHGQTP